MKNHRNDIKNEIAYFYKVIKNMDSKDNIKNSEIREHEISLQEIVYDNFSDDFDVDKRLFGKHLLGWIELVENENLHKALKSLKIEDQIFISYIVKECKTQRELAKIYNVDHRTVGRRFQKILNIIKKFLFKK